MMKSILLIAAIAVFASAEMPFDETKVSGSYVGTEPPGGDFISDYVTEIPSAGAMEVVHHKVLRENLIGQTITGHALLIQGAANGFHIYTPDDKCPGTAATSHTSAKHKCKLATNAGFFGMSDHSCVGHIVSDGRVIHSSASKLRAMFGITQDGKFIAGYGNESFIHNKKFKQLVQGRGWLVRNGKSYVETSAQRENIAKSFVQLHAPRLSIGWTKQGHLLLVIVDGVEAKSKGLPLTNFASLLINLGAVEAINLDGGGSVTFVWDGHICESSGVGQEACKGNPTTFGPLPATNPYERPVTSITCFK